MGRPKRDASGQIVRDTGNAGSGQDLAAFLQKSLASQIAVALPRHLDAERMTRVALTAIRTTPQLAECDRYSFAASILQASQLGLEVNTPLGHAYLIPRWNKDRGGMECTLQLGYQGMIELARRSGQVSTIFAYTVHEGDTFEYELGLDPKLKHVPSHDVEQVEATMTWAYAVAKLKGDEHDRQFVVLKKAEIDRRKDIGKGNKGPGPAWRQHYLARARKTAVRALFTWLPKSPDMAVAMRVDDRSADGAPTREVVDTVVAEQLAHMLPEDAERQPETEEVVDPSTGEVPPDSEPTDEELGRG